MAAFHLSRKLQTYRSLYRINRAFTTISRHVRNLEKSGFMPAAKMRVFRGLVRELQSQISHDVVDKMHAVEDQDMFEFGKTRINWEHRLNPDRPAFEQHSKPADLGAHQPERRKEVS